MSTIALNGDERLPLYQRLADSLRQEIVAARHSPGDRLPSENIIADDYGVAAGTARQALALLVQEGILERIHGKGTFVRRPSFDRSLFRFFRFRSANGERVVPESRILKKAVSPASTKVAAKLQIKPNDQTVYMHRLRLIEGAPVLVEEIWLPFGPFKALLDTEETEMGDLLYPLYDTLCGQVVARAEEDLTAECATAKTAKTLGTKAGAPLIIIKRLARGYDGIPLEWRQSRGLASQFNYHTEIR